ncbi:erythromycin esterase [Streptomyces sp. CB00455]|uniref:erythromycin esterase family protein n=1 Tax=Streptomyces sp. CB00455 TaxID=1703927 RepID=UPI00093F0A8C|nr:erythromycin esterase family protein [Streptomyces sp. CB00455]OKK17414.1 erythromycin esterase [Streptomyces sp. CB00455]
MRKHRPALLALLLTLGAVAAAAPASSATSPVSALERGAYPLRTTEPRGSLEDLRPLGRMVKDARVVGLGESTHSSHEFFAMKHRVLRYLVEEKGFRSFALEGSWSSGLRLNDYVLHGKGDPARIMGEEFQNSYSWWNNSDYLDLIRWMRDYNLRHPQDPVQFMGDDFGYAGPQPYDAVTAYLAEARPELLPQFAELYRGLRPEPTTTVDAYMKGYMERPLDQRQEMAARTGRALELLRQQGPGPAAGGGEAYAWAVQHATAIDQTARGYSFDFDDPGQVAQAMDYRDALMARNVAWWEEHTGDKVLLSAHTAHVALRTYDPEHYPRTQGGYLRDALGEDYVSIGTTFDQGSFNATGSDGKVRVHTVGPSEPGTNEHTLDRVRHRDYVLDLRTAPAAARSWLATARTTKSIGTEYPGPGAQYPVALGAAHDVLVHLHRVEAARLSAPPSPGAE